MQLPTNNPSHKSGIKSLFLWVLLTLTPLILLGQKRIYHTQKASSAINIDGLAKDAAWEKVKWSGDFTQRQPSDGDKPSQQTAFKILYDERNLYVLIRAFDNEPSKIVKRMSRRDGFTGDMVELHIDSYFDQRSAFSFNASVSGVKSDQMISNDGSDWDSSWDPIWYLKTSIDDKGWIAEFKIPLSQLRFGKKEQQTWGLQVNRRIFRKSEDSNWQYVSKNASGWVHHFGELHGLVGIKPQHQLEIMPYVVGQAQRYEKEEGNPYKDGKDENLSFGVDGKVGITSDITMDFSVNPDFGQVEADPAQVNLSAFEVFYREKRPFFVESKNILDYTISSSAVGGGYSSDNLFYSRRIGRVPQYSIELRDGEYLKQRANSMILGAFKLTGKTKKGLSFGILEAVTREEKAEIIYQGHKRKETVEPWTNYLVGRIQQDINKGQTVIGGIFTSTNRELNAKLSDLMHREAYTAGVDFVHRSKDRNYYVSGNFVGSNVLGSQTALLNTQTSERRYFQRPNAPHVHVDSALTSLSGTGASIKLGKSGGGYIRTQVGATYRSPGLETNDLGYLRSADQINQWAWVGYQSLKAFSAFRNLSVNLSQAAAWDFSGSRNSTNINVNTQMQFKNYWWAGICYYPVSEATSNYDLRGGPAIRYQGGNGFWNYLSSDSRKKVRFNLFHSHYWGNENSSMQHYYETELSFQPFNSLQISLFPNFSTNRSMFQYVDTKEYHSENRYIVASIQQQTLGASLRMNYIVKPNLSVQYYAQPFSSKGSYSDFKQITQANASELNNRYEEYSQDQIIQDKANNMLEVDENKDGVIDYSMDNPNFNYLQFRSNLVLRWEYIPGSTFFVVWSQSRTGDSDKENFSVPAIANGLSNIVPNDVFLVKYTYRFRL